jgi:hypothetical protein
VRPIYVTGRYDIVSLPAFCILAGWGISRWVAAGGHRWHRLRSGIVIVLLGILWTATLAPYYQGLQNPRYMRSSMSAAFLKDRMRPGDALVYLGLRRSRLEYALRSLGLIPSHQVSFPAELDRHPAWISLADMMSRMDKLRVESRSLADTLHQSAGPGNRVWVAAAGDNSINRLLLEVLGRRFQAADEMSSRALGIICLKAIQDAPQGN